MALTYGFYNSVNHDRVYDATQVSELFDGLIADGIYDSIGDKFIVREDPDRDNSVIVGTGRAWFNHTWTKNDADIIKNDAPQPEVAKYRIDALVLDIKSAASDRVNSLVWVSGPAIASNNPEKPTFTNVEGHYQHPLCYILRKPNTARIGGADIENAVGVDPLTPFVNGLIRQYSTYELLRQWAAQWLVFKQEYEDAATLWRQQQEAGFESWSATQRTAYETWVASQESDFTTWSTEQQNAFATWMTGQRTDFNSWFANIQYVLDGDAAGHLQNEIDDLAWKINPITDANTKGCIVSGVMDSKKAEIVSWIQNRSTSPNVNIIGNNQSITRTDGNPIEVYNTFLEGRRQSIGNCKANAVHIEGSNNAVNPITDNIPAAMLSYFNNTTNEGLHIEGVSNDGAGTEYGAHVEGYHNKVYDFYTHVEGFESIGADSAHTEGGYNKGFGDTSHVEGYGNVSLGKYSHIEGYGNQDFYSGTVFYEETFNLGASSAVTNATVSFGNRSKEGAGLQYEISGHDYPVTIPLDCVPLDGSIITLKNNGLKLSLSWNDNDLNMSFQHTFFSSRITAASLIVKVIGSVEGAWSIGTASHVEGKQNIAIGDYSHVEGRENIVRSESGHAEGYDNVIDGRSAHAEGDSNEVNGGGSHAEGSFNKINGDFSHAENGSNTVNGRYDHAEGYENSISGDYSHVGGLYNSVNGDRSFASGSNVSVSGNNSVIFGKDLMNLTDDQFMIGEGVDNPSEEPNKYSSFVDFKPKRYDDGSVFNYHGGLTWETAGSSSYKDFTATPEDLRKVIDGGIFVLNGTSQIDIGLRYYGTYLVIGTVYGQPGSGSPYVPHAFNIGIANIGRDSGAIYYNNLVANGKSTTAFLPSCIQGQSITTNYGVKVRLTGSNKFDGSYMLTATRIQFIRLA